jgi:hypothetical protein
MTFTRQDSSRTFRPVAATRQGWRGGDESGTGRLMSAREMKAEGEDRLAGGLPVSISTDPTPTPHAGQAGGASAFWLTIGAGTVPVHLRHQPDADGNRPETREMVTREVELLSPELMRLFKQT